MHIALVSPVLFCRSCLCWVCHGGLLMVPINFKLKLLKILNAESLLQQLKVAILQVTNFETNYAVIINQVSTATAVASSHNLAGVEFGDRHGGGLCRSGSTVFHELIIARFGPGVKGVNRPRRYGKPPSLTK